MRGYDLSSASVTCPLVVLDPNGFLGDCIVSMGQANRGLLYVFLPRCQRALACQASCLWADQLPVLHLCTAPLSILTVLLGSRWIALPLSTQHGLPTGSLPPWPDA